MKNESVLGIGIPTYNGENTISDSLESICSQDKSTHVVVVDNNSTDKTASVVKAFKHKGNVQYYKNKNNIGGEQNINQVFNRSCTDYVWIIGDDDLIYDFGIDRMLDIIKSTQHLDIGLYFINCSIWSRNLDICQNESFFSRGNNYLIHDKNKFLNEVGANAAFTPCLIMNRKKWNEIGITRFDGSGWMTLAKIYQVLSTSKGYFVREPLVVFRDGSERHHEDGKFFFQYLQLIEFFNSLKQFGYSEKVIKRKIKNILNGLYKNIIIQKEKGLKVNILVLKMFLTVLRKYPLYCILNTPVLLTPRVLVKRGIKIYHRIKNLSFWGYNELK